MPRLKEILNGLRYLQSLFDVSEGILTLVEASETITVEPMSDVGEEVSSTMSDGSTYDGGHDFSNLHTVY
ncbi:unnamed protein product [Fusarium graminearum]|uniref:Uncharacterized protein n=1 Tax=Gibberella zeae TaxID=5518 RepID=A0A9N8RRS0_GIBZA|nr:unnamed protein product [Fusarium graminearum]